MELEYIHPWINYFTDQGVPFLTVVLLLLFPFIATLVALLRQVVGLKAFGIYTPAIITFAFLATGLKYGIAVFAIVVFVGIFMRYIIKKMRLLYLPRVAITLTIVSFAILASLVIGGSLQRTGFAAVITFPLLIIISLVEKFVAVQIEKGSKTALWLALETLIVALLGYALMSEETVVGQAVIKFIVHYPWAVLLVIPFNIFLGKWTGLRLSEYLRFRDVLKKM